jgi:hypothetical protein
MKILNVAVLVGAALRYAQHVCGQDYALGLLLTTAEPYGTYFAGSWPGRNLDWLYVAEGGKLFRRAVKVNGAAVDRPTKPPKAPL